MSYIASLSAYSRKVAVLLYSLTLSIRQVCRFSLSIIIHANQKNFTTVIFQAIQICLKQITPYNMFCNFQPLKHLSGITASNFLTLFEVLQK